MKMEDVVVRLIYRRLVDALRRPSVRRSWIAFLIYALFTVVMTYPVPFHMNAVLAGLEYRDAYQYAWSLWWTKEAVLDPAKGLASLTLMNHPVGTEHPFMLTMAAVHFWALPFSLLFSPATVYNCQLLFSFVASGMAMYWFCVELTGNHWAGIFGGFVFAFFPNKTGHALGGHLPQITVYWIPLYALFLRRLVSKPGWRRALLSCVFLVPACLVHVIHVAYALVPITLVILFLALLEMRSAFFSWRRCGWLFAVFGLTALATVPFLLPTILLSLEGASYLEALGVTKHSIDLLAFATPSPYHPVLASLKLVPSFGQQVFPDKDLLIEGLAYPGLCVVVLAVWALARGWRQLWVWGGLALGVAVLALGPLLKVGGELVRFEVDASWSHVVLPYGILSQLPMLQVGRTPGRFATTAMFALAVLASYGAVNLHTLLKHRSRCLSVAQIFLLLVLGFEYVVIWPFPTSPAQVPAVIRSIAEEQGHGALLHIPIPAQLVNNRALYFQTFTERPIVRGYIHRLPPDVPPWSETLASLVRADQDKGDAVPRPVWDDRVAWLHYFDVDYVVFDKLGPANTSWRRDVVQEMLGAPKYEDEELVAFAVPEAVSLPESAYLYTLSEAGWYPSEKDGDVWRRWMYQDGDLYIYAMHGEVGSLRFTVDSHLAFPTLEVYQGEQLLDAFLVSDRTTYTTRPLTLLPGMNVFHFHAPGGCPEVLDAPCCWSEALLDPPDDCQLSCDPAKTQVTCRTFVFDHISFVPQGDSADSKAAVSFGNQMRLRGWTVDETTIRPGGALTLTLTWEAEVNLTEQHVVFVHLVSPDNKLVAQYDGPPVGRLVPAAVWFPGSVFKYPVHLQLPADLPAGDYRLLLGVYLWPNNQRFPVQPEHLSSGDDVIDLAQLRCCE